MRRRTLIGAAAALAAGIGRLGTETRMARAESVEMPRYEVVGRVGPNIEIRTYGPRIAAETDMDSQYSAFMRLANYIFATNRQSEEVAMTAPVSVQQSEPIAMTAPVAVQQSEPIAMTAPVAVQPDGTPAAGAEGEPRVMRFYMPSQYTMETLPKPGPGDEGVRILEVPEQTLAVIRFRGTATPELWAEKTAELVAGLAGSDWTMVGQPGTFGYSAPGTPPPQIINEVWVEVTPAG